MTRRVTCLFVLLFAAIGAGAGQSFYVNYDLNVPDAPLRLHPLSILHPAAVADLTVAHQQGNQVLAYISVGEIAADANYRSVVMERGLRLRGKNAVWDSDILDLGDERWLEVLVDQVAASALAKGYDGFFLDTLDSVDSQDHDALIRLVSRLRELAPDGVIIANRGFSLLGAMQDLVDGVLVESVFGTVDLATDTYRAVPQQQTEVLLAELKKWERAGLDVFVLDYADPQDKARAREISDLIQAQGWSAFVSTPDLRGACLAPWRQIPRRIYSLYGNLSTELIDHGRVTQTGPPKQLVWMG